jgi:hypothetical protein
MIEVIFQLEQLRCLKQYDGGGPSEPYLWVDFFWVDSGTFTDANPDVVATSNMLSGLSARNVLPENVRPGSVVAIPERIGRMRILLDDSIIHTPGAGFVFALLEENGTSDNLMQIGHRVFGEAFNKEINDYVRQHIPDVPPLSDADKNAMAERIKGKVFSAVEDAASVWEFFRSKDRVIGFASEFFSWPVLTLIRDLSHGQPYPLLYNLRSERLVIQNPQMPPVRAVDEYEVNASVRVTTFTPPAPDPCQAQKTALQAATQALKDLANQIAALQAELQTAAGPRKSDILKEIAELRRSRPALLAQQESAQKALQLCRNQRRIV